MFMDISVASEAAGKLYSSTSWRDSEVSEARSNRALKLF